ncbi:molybdopterin molybdotransferase MoeA [Alphaproteobacteria bacterium]|nr:molybdopterin molybdotransferase MoeA [Alphaproteobacteria bacterium]
MNKFPLTKLKIFNILKKISTIKLENEKVLLEKSLGRFLAKNLKSEINLPPFKNSAVDGYAILKKDIMQNKKNLIYNQRVAAGDKITKNLKPGEAARIFTGAKMPSNSFTVVMQENVIKKNNYISIKKMPKFRENCRLAGEDIKKGKKILCKGDKINISNVNIAAAIGKKTLLVKKKINIGYFTSGNELRKPTEKLKNSEINNSNYYSLNALLNKPYVNSKYLGILKDKEVSIIDSLIKNINKHELIITTGGASVGEEDYLIKVIDQLGKLYFWKTAIKPGRPLAIGKINNTIIVCLPGNPVSVHLLYGMIVSPFIEYLCSGNFLVPEGVLAKTNFIMKKKNKRLEWLRVNIVKNKKNLVVSKYFKQGSGMISSMVFADGILEIPEEVRQICKNQSYYFYSFKDLF